MAADDNPTDIFDRFTRADNSVPRQFGGTGLGLAICEKLAELMGARLVRSTPGEGSAFTLTLPTRSPDTAV